MHILVVSKYNNFSIQVIKKMQKEGHSVTLFAFGENDIPIQGSVKIFRPPLSASQYRDICHNYSFSAAIFLTCAYEDSEADELSQELTVFQEVLCACNWKHVILQSDCHLFDISPDNDGCTMRQRDRNIAETQIVLFEILFQRYCEQNQIPLAILRTGYIYDPQSKTTNIPALFCGDKTRGRIVGSLEDDINLLHIGDALDAFIRCLSNAVTGIYNICAAQWVSANWLYTQLAVDPAELPAPGIKPRKIIDICEDPVLYRPTVYAGFKRCTDWIPIAQLSDNLHLQPEEPARAKDRAKWWTTFLTKNPIPIVEILMGFVIAVGLQKLLFSVANLRTFDMLVVYITLIACKYGTGHGVFASALACVYYYFNSIGASTSITDMLFYSNMWMPFIVYILLGTILGYRRKLRIDETKIANERLKVQEQKYQLSKELCEEALSSKELLQEQIFNFENSFGKVFKMIEQLNALQSEKVLTAAIRVFEQAIHAERIAIYSLSFCGSYARLISCSNKLENASRSIDLSETPDLKLAMSEGRLYVNRQLSDGISYACPISIKGFALYFMALYGCSLQQFTLAFQNQFHIICLLVQNSLLQALQYEQATWQQRHIGGTLVLNAEAFSERINALLESESRAQGLVFRVIDPVDIQELSDRITPLLRQHDFVGLSSQGHINVVFQGTCEDDKAKIIERMNTARISLQSVRFEGVN